MTRPANSHLSLDDIDALLEADAQLSAYPHLDHCASCREQVAAERDLVVRLAALAWPVPSAKLADRVMARVIVPAPAFRRSLAAAASLTLLLGAGALASILWSLGNRETLAAAGSWLGSEAVSWLWIGIRGVASNLIEQPWYDRARDFAGVPSRLAAISAGASLAYFAGLLTLRKLMALPRQGVAHARA